MKELSLDIENVGPWFLHEKEVPHIIVRVEEHHSKSWPHNLSLAVRRCYLSDELLSRSVAKNKISESAVIESKLPDQGSVMAGDFGEILVYLYQSAMAHPGVAVGVLKWRLKQDRLKAAPHSDVVQFILPQWPQASDSDKVICAEVKTKSKKGQFTPIPDAIAGSQKDRASRLLSTLLWLRERSLTEDLGEVQISHLNRFIDAIDFPPAEHRFNAVVVISSELVDAEISSIPAALPSDCTLIIMCIPDLYNTYQAVFVAAKTPCLIAATPEEVPVV